MAIAATKQKKYLPMPIFLVITLIIGIGIYSFIKKYPVATPIDINEITTTGSVTLSLTPATAELSPNVDTTISLVADSGTDRLSVVKFEITYDPTKVTVGNLTKGTWLTKELSYLTINNGKITGELGAQPDNTTSGGTELQRTGSGTLLTFKAKGLSSGTYTLTLNSAVSNAYTITGTTANTTNMLKAVSGTTLTIINPRPKSDLIQSQNSTGQIINIVDTFDYSELVRQYGKTPAGSADIVVNNAVDGGDYTFFMTEYGKTW